MILLLLAIQIAQQSFLTFMTSNTVITELTKHLVLMLLITVWQHRKVKVEH